MVVGVPVKLHGMTPRARVLTKLAPQSTREMLQRVLEAALAIEDKKERARVLMELAPHLTNEERIQVLEHALEAALAIEDREARVRMLTGFLPFESDQIRLLQSIRGIMVDYSISIRHLSRRAILSSLFRIRAFAPPIFSFETLAAITSHVIEICEDWMWL